MKLNQIEITKHGKMHSSAFCGICPECGSDKVKSVGDQVEFTDTSVFTSIDYTSTPYKCFACKCEFEYNNNVQKYHHRLRSKLAGNALIAYGIIAVIVAIILVLYCQATTYDSKPSTTLLLSLWQYIAAIVLGVSAIAAVSLIDWRYRE
jgi:hypothetical protein